MLGLLSIDFSYFESFLHHYAPWLPVVRLIRNGSLDNISSFLSTVILATSSRTLAGISHACSKRLRELALNYVGQIFANPTSYPLIESLYALLILVLWPLDPADDVELLVHGAKRMASAGGRFNKPNTPNDQIKDSSDDDMLDLTRLVSDRLNHESQSSLILLSVVRYTC